jgi:hypothetical protein
LIQNARLTPGRGFKPINSILYYGMRLLPYARSRRRIACVIARCVNWCTSSVLEDTKKPLDRIAACLERDGCVSLEPVLSQLQIDEILAFLDKKKVVSGGRSFVLSRVPNDVLRAAYSLRDVLQCPHLLSLMNNSKVLRIARNYLGCTPTISGLGLHWSFPQRDSVVDVQCFHRDPDDWRFLKLFVYLTDVDEQSGPHEFVARSHRSSGRIFSRPYTEQEVERSYGCDHVFKMVGVKGTNFLADTWGIHRGNVPVSRPRLLLQIEYSILPIMKFEYRPLRLPRAENYDRHINRLLLAAPDR